MKIQRFKPALTTGNWPDNPEELVRDDSGKYMLYSDHVEMIVKITESLHDAGAFDGMSIDEFNEIFINSGFFIGAEN